MALAAPAKNGLLALRDGVAAYFLAQGVPATVGQVGIKYRYFQVNEGPGGAMRVVFMPGEYDGSDAPRTRRGGTLSPPRKASGQDSKRFAVPSLSDPSGFVPGPSTLNPAPLASNTEIATVSVWAVDPLDPQDEESAYIATFDLFELTLEAMHRAVDPDTGVHVGVANLRPGDYLWSTPVGERAFGRELLYSFEHKGLFFFQPIDKATPQPAIHRNPPA
jgi:hypothetical protein